MSDKVLFDPVNESQLFLQIWLNKSGRLLTKNVAFQNRFSTQLRDNPNLDFQSVIHPADQLIFKNIVEQNSEASIRVQIRLKTKSDDTYKWSSWEFRKQTIQGENQIWGLGIELPESFGEMKFINLFTRRVDRIIQQLNDAFFVLDKHGNIITCNSPFSSFYRKQPSELIQKSIWDLEPEMANSEFGKNLKQALEKKETITFIQFTSRLNKWIKVTCYYSEEGLTVFVRDYTQEYKNQLSLLESETKLKAIFNSGQNIQLLVSIHFELLYFNQAANDFAQQVLGRNLVENENFLNCIDAFPFEDIINQFQTKAINSQVIREEKLIFKIAPEGLWHRISYTPVRITNELLGINILAENIHRTRLAEIENADLAKALAALYNSSGYSKLLIDKNYKVIFFNKTAAAFVRREFGIHMERNGDVFTYINNQLLPDFKQFIDTALSGKYVEKEYIANFPKSGVRSVRLEIHPVYDEQKQVMGAAYNAIDISNQKEDRARLELQANRLKEIAFTQSHIIRRPVANLIGLIALLDHSNLNEENQFLLQKMEESLQELDRVIVELVGKSSGN